MAAVSGYSSLGMIARDSISLILDTFLGHMGSLDTDLIVVASSSSSVCVDNSSFSFSG